MRSFGTISDFITGRSAKLPFSNRLEIEINQKIVANMGKDSIVLEIADECGECNLHVLRGNPPVMLDSLLLFKSDPNSDEKYELDLVVNDGLEKTGIYMKGIFIAVIDFKNRKSCCREGLPKIGGLWNCAHDWDEGMLKGLLL